MHSKTNLHRRYDNPFRIIAFILFSGAMHTNAQSRVIVEPISYENLTLTHLLSVYKTAYKDAGFKIKSQKISTTFGGSGKLVHLIFEISFPEFPKMGSGIVSFNVSQYGPQKKCEPCEVSASSTGLDIKNVPYEVYSPIMTKFEMADLKANAQIRMALGKSVRPKAPTHDPDNEGFGP